MRRVFGPHRNYSSQGCKLSDLAIVLGPDAASIASHVGWSGFPEAGTCTHVESQFGEDFAVVTRRQSSHPLAGVRLIEENGYVYAFAGDLVGFEYLPLRSVGRAVLDGNGEFLAGLDGVFVAAAIDLANGSVVASTDRRGQKPLFVATGIGATVLSTCLATFLYDGGFDRFDPAWLWESLYFNYPISDSTFAQSVKRVPAASFVRGGGENQHISIYADPFVASEMLASGPEALRLARETFTQRMPEYFEGSSSIACALTGGWDGRTMFALSPDDRDITTYTYGNPGCSDLVRAAETAQQLGAKHIPIFFDLDFVESLPELALETVLLTGGLQGVLRSTLLHAYRSLTENGRRFPLTVSGIAFDMLFRGHAHCPDLISPDLEQRFRGRPTGRAVIDWRHVFPDSYANFKTHVDGRLDELQKKFGDFSATSHHLSFITYPLSTHHFCGELALADYFTTVRVPSWDSAIVNLAYSIDLSTLSFSQFKAGHRRGRREEMILQSFLFREMAPDVFDVPVGGIPPSAVLGGDTTFFLARLRRAAALAHQKSIDDAGGAASRELAGVDIRSTSRFRW